MDIRIAYHFRSVRFNEIQFITSSPVSKSVLCVSTLHGSYWNINVPRLQHTIRLDY